MPDETPIHNTVLTMINTALADLKRGQEKQTESMGKLHEKVNESNVAVTKVEGKLDGFVTKEEFAAHEETVMSRCLQMHGASAIDPNAKKKTTSRSKPVQGPWWTYLFQGPAPYLIVIVALVVVLVVATTGRPVDDFIPHREAPKEAQP
jgi:hypothetical protein